MTHRHGNVIVGPREMNSPSEARHPGRRAPTIAVRLLVAFLLVAVVPAGTFALLSLREGEAHAPDAGQTEGIGGEGNAEAVEAAERAAGTESLLGLPIATIELAVAGATLLLGTLMALYLARTIVRPIRTLEAAMGRVESGDLDARASLSGDDEIARLGAAFDRMVVGLRRERLIRDLFGQYVTPELAQVAIEAEGHLEGKVVECSILFADIRGFTALAEVLPAHHLIETLNSYLATMLREVAAEGGIVNKFGGDSILAVFGSPLNPAPDHPARAVRASIRMNTALDAFNEAQAAADMPEIRAGFGVATGEVVAGNLGSERKIEYTVIGDPVNLASRLQELTRELGEPILVAASTAERASGAARLTSMGEQPIRGRTEPIEVYSARQLAAAPASPA